MSVFNEIYQNLFILSIIFVVYILGDITMKMIGRFTQKNPEIRFILTTTKGTILWISVSIIISFLI